MQLPTVENKLSEFDAAYRALKALLSKSPRA